MHPWKSRESDKEKKIEVNSHFLECRKGKKAKTNQQNRFPPTSLGINWNSFQESHFLDATTHLYNRSFLFVCPSVLCYFRTTKNANCIGKTYVNDIINKAWRYGRGIPHPAPFLSCFYPIYPTKLSPHYVLLLALTRLRKESDESISASSFSPSIKGRPALNWCSLSP